MMFNQGNVANAIAKDGQEVKVRIEAKHGNGYLIRPLDENGLVTGTVERVLEEQLLRVRGPFFDIRGQVLTTSKQHPNEVGEIVALGESPTGKQYYQIQFKDRSHEWFDADSIFIQHTPSSQQ